MIDIKINNPKKHHLTMLAVLVERSNLYLTYFCSFKFDLNFNFEINSCKAPTGQANPQKIRPKIKVVKINRVRIIIIGIMRRSPEPTPITSNICCIGMTALGIPPKRIPPRTNEIM